MSMFEPERPEGAEIHECESCHGDGFILVDGDEVDCEDCDGTGEWFE